MIIDGPDEDIGAERFAGDAGSEQIFSLIVVAVVDEDLRYVLHFVAAERRSVVEFT